MPRKTELSQMTCNDLRGLAKILDISKRWSMMKAELVEAILRAEENVEDNKQSATDETKNDNHDAEAVSNKKHTAAIIDMEQKMPYIEQAAIGTIIAFRLPNGKVKSAKIIKRSTKNRRFMVETEYNAQYVVESDNVVWVRTGDRWPKGVYRLLKGLDDKDGKQK